MIRNWKAYAPLLCRALFASLISWVTRRTSGRLLHRRSQDQSALAGQCAPTTRSESNAPRLCLEHQETGSMCDPHLRPAPQESERKESRGPIFGPGNTLVDRSSRATLIQAVWTALLGCCGLRPAGIAPEGKAVSSPSLCRPTWLATDQLMEPTPWMGEYVSRRSTYRVVRSTCRQADTSSGMVSVDTASSNFLANDERMHHYQRERALIAGLGL
jgi:hypothetical protein